MSDNKVDLSSVNKNKKPKARWQFLGNLRKPARGPLRDEEGKFATTGSGGLTQFSNFDLKRVVPVIMIIALVGGLFVFKSFAGGSQAEVTKWYRTCLDREPDAGGLNYWSGRLDNGENAWAVARAFLAETSADDSCSFPNESKVPKTTTTAKQKTTTTTEQPAATSESTTSSSSGDSRVAAYYRACNYSSIPQSGTNHDYWKNRLNTEKEPEVWKAFKANSEKNGRSCSVSSPFAGNASTTSTTTTASGGIPQYNAKLTDFMDTRAFVWFAYQQICYAGTGTGVSWWVKEIDAGRWTRENFWKHLAAQPCAQSTAQKRADQDKNLTADGQKMKEIDTQLNAKYWEVFLEAWEQKGYGDWDGKTRTGWGWLEDSDPQKARIACEEMVWKYKNGIAVGLSETCLKLVTGVGKNITSQDVLYGDYFGDTVTIGDALSRIEAIKNGEDQSISCQSAKAQLLPACGAGAVHTSVQSVQEEIDRREAEQEEESDDAPTSSATPKKQSSPVQKNVVEIETAPLLSTPTSLLQQNDGEEDIYQGMAPYSEQIEQLLSVENSIKASVVYPTCDGFDDLELSAEGECVEYAETALALIADPNIAVDGFFDEDMQDQLLDFQDSRNVPNQERGKLGSTTYNLMNKALEPRVSESPYSPPTGTLVNNR